MHHRRPLALVVAFSLVACSSFPARPGEHQDDEDRFGPVFSQANVDVHLERSPQAPQPLADRTGDFGWTACIEDGDLLLLGRLDWMRAVSRFDFGPGSAQTDVGLLSCMAGPVRWSLGPVRVSPLVGVGLGYARFLPRDVPMEGDSGILFALVAGLDVEILHHGQIQLLATYGVFGEPGDTEGEVSTVSIGGGLRF
jgi:hypothetical protein